jgi:2-phosphosulfolactate phosphatase
MNEMTVHWLPAHYESASAEDWQDAVAIVFDVLRATSTIVTAMASGWHHIRAFRHLDDARAEKCRNHDCLLAGEQGGRPPPDFDFGNSPREFIVCAPEQRQSPLAMATTNGTRAIHAARLAKEILIASLLNITAVAEAARSSGASLAILCAGTGENASFEDLLGAGMLLELLGRDHPARSVYRAWRHRIPEALKESKNGRRLLSLGLSADIEWCAQVDAYAIVPAAMGDGTLTVKDA